MPKTGANKKSASARPKTMASTGAEEKAPTDTTQETFVILDPMQMHTEAMNSCREYKETWEGYFRNHILTEQRYALITRILFTYPSKHKTSVLLHRTFPILKNAALSDFEPGFAIKNAQFNTLGNVDLKFCATFDTREHGRVFLVAISCLSPDPDPNICGLKIGRLAPSAKHLTLSMTNYGDPDNVHVFMVSLVVPFTGCRLCSQLGHSPDTRPRMRKCGRCWKNNGTPVWYCDPECQRLDYKRHRRCDGCGAASSSESAYSCI
jgi:hypothetical protein